MLDTAAVAWAILEREPGRTRKLYATDWNLGEKEALPWVAFLAGLHDLGKASPVFQAAWDEGAKRVWDAGLTWDEELVREQWVAHGVFTELYVKDVLKRHGLPLRLADPLAKGLGAHHGFLAQGEELKTARLHVKSEASTWQEVRDHLALRLAQSLGLNLPLVLPVEDAEAPAILRVMALASFADWIASDPRFFPYGRDPEALEYWQDALELARKALEDLPWPRVSPRGVRRFEEKIRERQVEVHLPHTAHTDPEALFQILLNLLDNALKYGQDPIRLLSREEGGRLLLEVRDHGPELPDYELLFLPRHRGFQGGAGQGLGLYLVRRIAQGLGGEAYALRDGAENVFGVALPLN